MSSHALLITSIAFYVVLLCGTGYYVIRVRRSTIFQPITLILFFTSLFTLPLPLRAWMSNDIEGDVSPYLPLFEAYLPMAVFLTALALPLICWAYYSKVAGRLANRFPNFGEINPASFRMATYSLIGFSLILIALLAKDNGGIVQYLLLGYNSSEEAFGQGYLAIGFPWLIVAMMAMLECYVRSRVKLDLLAFAVLLLANVAIQVITGNRGLLVYIAIVLVLYWNFRIGHVRLKVLLPIAIAAFLVLNVIGLIRNSNYSDLSDFIHKTTTSVTSLKGSGDSGDLFYTLTTGEFVVPFETFPQMIRTIGVTDSPWLGLSLARAPLFAIPNILYATRPPSLTSWYMESFYGGGYTLNQGRAFFFLAEGYLNFGPFGVALIAALWGWIWGALDGWMRRAQEKPAVVLTYAVVVGFIFRCVAGDFSTLLIATTEQGIAGILFIVWLAKLFSSRSRDGHGSRNLV